MFRIVQEKLIIALCLLAANVSQWAGQVGIGWVGRAPNTHPFEPQGLLFVQNEHSEAGVYGRF